MQNLSFISAPGNLKKTNANGIQQKEVFFQPKLTINQSNDVYEREADAMADKVTQQKQTSFFKPAFSFIQKKDADCGKEDSLQCKENSSNNAMAPASTHHYLHSISGGTSLRQNEKNLFESRMNFDFSNVKIHTNEAANHSAKSLQAKAYTHENNIVFAQNQYQPNTNEGKKLIAHELTHVMQQSPPNSIQKKDDNQDNPGTTQGWENDMESFSKVAAENYLHVDRNILFDSITNIKCSATSAEGRECTVTTKEGMVITVLWNTDTKRVLVKANLNGRTKACGYNYSTDNNSVKFTRIKCWLH
ncbi:MAG: DUF4157 domain-containing protein [Bacteroidota bacterium]|nr:DUF4157 domain-containing protein [Bacteroidota bacterium]